MIAQHPELVTAAKTLLQWARTRQTVWRDPSTDLFAALGDRYQAFAELEAVSEAAPPAAEAPVVPVPVFASAAPPMMSAPVPAAAAPPPPATARAAAAGRASRGTPGRADHSNAPRARDS